MINSPSRKSLDWKKYILAFIITAVIFGIGIYINNKLDQKRFADIQNVQDQISLDLLSSETQFDLLKQSTCTTDGSSSILSQELNSLSSKLSYMEANSANGTSGELLSVKKYYSLLEIKDYLLMKQLSTECRSKPISVLYFYGNKNDCPECEKMGFVLTYLREQYPELRIYSFDNNLSLSAITTLNSLYKIDRRALPALVIGDKTYVGFRDINAIKELIPQLVKIDKERVASSTKSRLTNTASSTQ